MATEKPTIALQENLLTMLAYDDVNGRIIARMVDPALFEGDYRLVAEACIAFWKKHDAAPRLHLADEFDSILKDQYDRRRPAILRILQAMHEIQNQVNAQYVLDQLRRFTRLQRMKDTIIRSAELLNSNQELAVEDVQTMWNSVLRARDISFEPGIWLNDVERMMAYIDSREREFDVGIEQLDRCNAVPMRGNVLLFLGGAGAGKTWFLIHCGKRALMQHKKICHITLELSEELTLQRYYQALFSLPKRNYPDGFPVTALQFEREKLKGFERTMTVPDFTFKSPGIRMELDTRIQHMGTRFNNLIIKRFPPKQLDCDMLNSYLDNLEATEGFMPDLLILDYLKEMKTDIKQYRHAMDNNLSELRGVAVERNLAVATAQQLSRAGAEAVMAKASHVAEAWGLIGTSDVVLTFSATEQEREHGLARMNVSKNREDEGHFTILLTQNYRLGQFVLETAPLHGDYFDRLNHYTGKTNPDDDGDDDDDE